jgi:two-component system, NarL family, nitrate/nitrite response regulator NarL
MTQAQILLVDDHNMILEGMKTILSQFDDLLIINTAENAFDAMEILRKNPDINLVISDINLPDISGIELCGKIKKEFPTIQVIGLSTFNQRSYVNQMIQNGASGYLIKSASPTEIHEAIGKVMAGKMHFSEEINTLTETKKNRNNAPALTRREKEVLLLISEGQTNNAMAEKLFISPYTIDSHRKNLIEKFKVANTAQLIKMAGEFGLI